MSNNNKELLDFGFTFEEERVITDTRFDRMYDLVIPFLQNLKKNPDSATIKWPNREQEITKFIRIIDAIKDDNE
jgi:hypothetical protein